jgi:predicted Rossmann fold nucleotide-binding protein DprA/Smf involved in DNA uptake
MRVLRITLAALYGQEDGKQAAQVARHTQVVSALRRRLDDLDNSTWLAVSQALRADGLTAEALYLMDNRRIAAAEVLIDSCRLITAACPVYPEVLLKRLQYKAPPVLWISDTELSLNPPWLTANGEPATILGGVGCRQPLTLSIVIARSLGQFVGQKKFLGLSGGAIGCDAAFAEGVVNSSGSMIHILPCGLNKALWPIEGYAISPYSPNTPFSTAQAMERNAMIYAMATGTVVCSARFRLGGSWYGATAAIRSKQPVGVVDWTSSSPISSLVDQQQGTYGVAQRALVSQGGYAVSVDLPNLVPSLLGQLEEFSNWAEAKRSGAFDVGLFAS